jgi:hypothetical protein
MKKFLLFILVATSSAQAWPFHKKPRYSAQEIAQQEQHARDVQAMQEKDRANQWERIKGLREQVLKSSPIMEAYVLQQEQIATGTHYSSGYPGSPAPDLNKYETYLLEKVNEINARDAWWKIKGDVKKAIEGAKTEADLENPAKTIAAIKKQLTKQEAPDSWHDQSIKGKKEDADQLLAELTFTQERLKKAAYEEKVKADKIAQADADYEARKKLSEEERQAIYKTNGAAQQNDFLRSLSPEKREEVERYYAEIAARLASVVHENRAEIDFSASRAGSASAGPIFTPADIDRIVNERVATFNSIKSDPRPLQPVDPNVQWAASPSKVDYSIITLPSGETTSVLTYH